MDKIEAYIKREGFYNEATGTAIRDAYVGMTSHGMKADLAFHYIEELIDVIHDEC